MVPTIFWSAHAEGVLTKNEKHLDPDGCLVQQRGHRTYEDAAKAAEDTRLIRQKTEFRAWGATLPRKKLWGEVHFLDKGLFMGTI
jgi:hypothetical protein